jgi:hypothetical protein
MEGDESMLHDPRQADELHSVQIWIACSEYANLVSDYAEVRDALEDIKKLERAHRHRLSRIIDEGIPMKGASQDQ